MTEPQGHTPTPPAFVPWEPITARVPAALPTVETEYHQFWRTERHRWWRPLLIVVLTGLLWLLVMLVGTMLWFMVEQAITGRPPRVDVTTPPLFAVNNVVVGLLVPICLGTSWLFTGQRPKWLISVVGGFRWRWVLRCLAIVVPVWLVYTGVQFWAGGVLPTLAPNEWTVFLIVVILLTTPFQAAGEELLLRGVLARAIGAWFGSARVGLIVGTIVTAVAFMLLHGAGDPWLNAFYAVFGVCAAVLVWRTGGLEAAIVIHVVNNMLAESIMPFGDISEMFERSAGVGSPAMLIDMGVVVLVSAVLYWQAGRAGVARRSAPGAVAPATTTEPGDSSGAPQPLPGSDDR